MTIRTTEDKMPSSKGTTFGVIRKKESQPGGRSSQSTVPTGWKEWWHRVEMKALEDARKSRLSRSKVK